MRPLFPCRHHFQSSDELDVLQDNSWHAPPGFLLAFLCSHSRLRLCSDPRPAREEIVVYVVHVLITGLARTTLNTVAYIALFQSSAYNEGGLLASDRSDQLGPVLWLHSSGRSCDRCHNTSSTSSRSLCTSAAGDFCTITRAS